MDPLSAAQKKQIYSYISERFFANCPVWGTITPVFKEYHGYPYNRLYLNRVEQILHQFTPILSRDATRLAQSEIDFDRHEIEFCAKDILGEERFNELRQILLNPSIRAHELGIDPADRSQVFAARVLIKEMCKRYNQLRLKEVLEAYAQKIATEKMDLLMRNDPVQKLDPVNPNPSSLDLVLANTHFEKIAPWRIFGFTIKQPSPEEREQMRGAIRDRISAFAGDPGCGFLIDCLASLIRREKGQIFISNQRASVDSLVPPRHKNPEQHGLYNRHHSIYIPALSDPHPYTVLGHELLHMLLDHIPYFFQSADRSLQEALEQDCQVREGIDFDALSPQEFADFECVLRKLEVLKTYFPQGYNSDNLEQRQFLHMEAIVRPLDCLLSGIPVSTLEKMMPNLWDYYQKIVVPALRMYYL